MSAQPKTSMLEDHTPGTYHTTTHADGTKVIELDFERVSGNRDQTSDVETPVKFKKQSLTDWLKSRWYDIGVVLLFCTCAVTVAKCLSGIQSF